MGIRAKPLPGERHSTADALHLLEVEDIEDTASMEVKMFKDVFNHHLVRIYYSSLDHKHQQCDELQCITIVIQVKCDSTNKHQETMINNGYSGYTLGFDNQPFSRDMGWECHGDTLRVYRASKI